MIPRLFAIIAGNSLFRTHKHHQDLHLHGRSTNGKRVSFGSPFTVSSASYPPPVLAVFLPSLASGQKGGRGAMSDAGLRVTRTTAI